MCRHFSIGVLVVVCLAAWGTSPAAAQQATVTNRFNRSSDSFFEQNSAAFGFTLFGGGNVRGVSATAPFPTITPNITFQQNNLAPAPFGGAPAGVGTGNGGATLGFQINGKGGSANFLFSGGQGSSRGNTSMSPSITLTNGVPGVFSDTSQRPFVTNVGGVLMPVGLPGINIPDVYDPGPGARYGSLIGERLSQMQQDKREKELRGEPTGSAPAANPLNGLPGRDTGDADPITRKLEQSRESSAGQPSASVDEIRRKRQSENLALQREAELYVEKGQQAVAAGKAGLAKTYYQMARSRASGELKLEIDAALRSLTAPSANDGAAAGTTSPGSTNSPPANAAPGASTAGNSALGNTAPSSGLNAGRPVIGPQGPTVTPPPSGLNPFAPRKPAGGK